MIGILGYGRSGKSIAGFLSSRGEEFFISEKRDDIEIPYPSETGGHTERLLDMDLLIVSPGIPLDIPILEKARSRNIQITGEFEYSSRFIKGSIVAITGTNGKTTTAAMAAHILKNSRRLNNVLLGGNIYPGVPLSQLIEISDNNTVTVVEVSSFQLERIDRFRPHVGVIMNISPDHLDRHRNFEEYKRAKFRIFENQNEDDYSVLNLDDDNLKINNLISNTIYFSLKEKADIYLHGKVVKNIKGQTVFSRDDVGLPGEIFIEDAMAASLVADVYGLNRDEIREGIKSFKGVEHRMETVLKNGKRWIINNSMCTNPIAFRRSLEAFPGSCVIVGGRMKVDNLEPIISSVKKYAEFVILLGESSRILADSLERIGYNKYSVVSSMKRAVEKSRDNKCDKLILSPGGSSFDMYKDFTERGKDFRQNVRKIYES